MKTNKNIDNSGVLKVKNVMDQQSFMLRSTHYVLAVLMSLTLLLIILMNYCLLHLNVATE